MLVKHSIDANDAPRLARNLLTAGFKTSERVLTASKDALKRAGFTDGDVEMFKCAEFSIALVRSHEGANVPVAAVVKE